MYEEEPIKEINQETDLYKSISDISQTLQEKMGDLPNMELFDFTNDFAEAFEDLHFKSKGLYQPDM